MVGDFLVKTINLYGGNFKENYRLFKEFLESYLDSTDWLISQLD